MTKTWEQKISIILFLLKTTSVICKIIKYYIQNKFICLNREEHLGFFIKFQWLLIFIHAFIKTKILQPKTKKWNFLGILIVIHLNPENEIRVLANTVQKMNNKKYWHL